MKKFESVSINAKVISCFDDEEEARIAMNGWRYKLVVDEIWNQVFRPHFKHGYNDELLDSEQAAPIIEELSKRYQQVIKDEGEDL